jgi:hypothetical protein
MPQPKILTMILDTVHPPGLHFLGRPSIMTTIEDGSASFALQFLRKEESVAALLDW